MTGIIEDEVTAEPLGEIIPPEAAAKDLFVPNGLDKIIGLIRKEVEQFQPDVSTEKGRKAIASMARKVASSKTRLEEYGKNLSAAIKVQAQGIDAERKRMKETLDALRDQVRKPLDDYEAAVKARVDDHEQALKDVAALSDVPFGSTVAEIEERIAKLDEFALRQWEEFADRFAIANDAVGMRLGRVLAETKQHDENAIALKKLADEQAARESEEAKARQEREQAERDERITREATEKAEAAAKAAQEAADARAAKAEADAKAAAEKAEADKLAAVEAERQRAEAEKKAEEAATKAREADKAHKQQIESAAVAAIALFVPEVAAKEIVKAIAAGKVPHVKVIY